SIWLSERISRTVTLYLSASFIRMSPFCTVYSIYSGAGGAVGASVGAAVGTSVGTAVGGRVGASVGAAVGASVGAAVGGTAVGGSAVAAGKAAGAAVAGAAVLRSVVCVANPVAAGRLVAATRGAMSSIKATPSARPAANAIPAIVYSDRLGERSHSK